MIKQFFEIIGGAKFGKYLSRGVILTTIVSIGYHVVLSPSNETLIGVTLYLATIISWGLFAIFMVLTWINRYIANKNILVQGRQKDVVGGRSKALFVVGFILIILSFAWALLLPLFIDPKSSIAVLIIAGGSVTLLCLGLVLILFQLCRVVRILYPRQFPGHK